MHITLVLRELAAALAPEDPSAAAPSLGRLLARAALRVEQDGWAAALAPLYGIARQQDWPLAPLRAQRHGIDAAGAYWLHVTPVTMVPGRDDVRIAGAAVVDPAEAQALLASLTAHFAADGLGFIAAAENEWLVRVTRTPSLVTRGIETVIGQPLRALLSAGDDADEWRRWEQEIQMLLHTHPVNEAREAAGEVPVNGLWFDEGGTLPPADARPSIATFGSDDRLAALAHAIGTDALPAAASLAAALDNASAKQHVVLDEPVRDLAAIDRAFAQPAEAALRSGDVDSVTVMTASAHGRIGIWAARPPGMLQRLLPARSVDVRRIVHDAFASESR